MFHSKTKHTEKEGSALMGDGRTRKKNMFLVDTSSGKKNIAAEMSANNSKGASSLWVAELPWGSFLEGSSSKLWKTVLLKEH